MSRGDPSSQLKRGDPVTAKVVEILDAREMILRIVLGRNETSDTTEALLLRVANETRRSLRIGDRVQMRVVEVDPLRFQFIADSAEQRRSGRIDVSI